MSGPLSPPSDASKAPCPTICSGAIEPLATELRAQNRTLHQIAREGLAAIYELRGAGGIRQGYEVILIKVSKPREIFGKWYPEREVYPSDEEFGSRAWSYPRNDLVGAKWRFDGLVAKAIPKGLSPLV